MEKLKKFLMFSICLFSIFLINTKNVKAYGEEVTPFLNLNNYDFTFEIETITDSAKKTAENYILNNCQSYDHYLITSVSGYITSSSTNSNAHVYCWNDNNLEYIKFQISKFSATKNRATIDFSIYNGSSITLKAVDINSSGSILRENTITSNSGTISYYLNKQMYFDGSQDGNFIFPYIKSDLKVALSNGSIYNGYSYIFNSIKYGDVIYNVGDEVFDFENGTFKNPIPDPSFEYEISDGTEQGKKLSLFFNGYKESDYAIINNYQTGEEITILDLKNNSTKIFDNISLDNTFQVNIYNENNELIKDVTIDIQQELFITEERYILIRNLNVKETNSYTANYLNTKKDDKCFYKFKDKEEVELDCGSQTAMITSPNKNTYVEHYIKNKKGEIVVRKNVNLNYLKNLPQFKFESYYDDNENKQILEIIVENLQESDIISYSYDNEYWYTLETKRINYLDFYNSSDVYFKLERNSEVISEAYFDVVYNSYVNSSNNNNLENTNFSLKNLLDSFKKYSKNNKTLNIGADVYNQLKNSKLGLYIIIIITGSFIILFVKSIKR